MERTQPQPHEEESTAPEVEVSGEEAAAPLVRCPYCHEDLPEGARASACQECGTLHHLSCFAEHRGCSTHGCSSHRGRSVRVGQVESDGKQLLCTGCKHACPPSELVAYCPGCYGAQHVSCYEERGSCANQACQSRRPVTIVTVAEARAALRAMHGRLLMILGGGVGAVFATAFLAASPQRGNDLIFLGLIMAFSLGVMLWGGLMRRGARIQLEDASPPLPPARPRPRAKGSGKDTP
jgi:hypothetical protein